MDRSRSIIMYMARIQKRMWWWLREIENAENSPSPPLTKGEEEVQSASLTYTNKRFILPSSSSLGQMQRDQDALRWDAYRWIFYGVEKRGSDSEREKMAKKCISPQKLNFSSAALLSGSHTARFESNLKPISWDAFLPLARSSAATIFLNLILCEQNVVVAGKNAIKTP